MFDNAINDKLTNINGELHLYGAVGWLCARRW